MKIKKLNTSNAVGRPVGRPAKATSYVTVLRDLMNKEDGVITIDLFVRKCPRELKDGALDFLRNAKGGDFIEGRRGHPSRFVFGDTQEKWRHSEEIRRQWRIRNGRNPLTGGPLKTKRRGRPSLQEVQARGRRQLNEGKNGGAHKVNLQLNVGGQKHIVPVEMSVIPSKN